MNDALQDLVDALARELRRSVAVEDLDLRLLVSSAHFEDVDRARLASLVGRRASDPIRDYVWSTGVRTWHTPALMPPNPRVGIDRGRYCFPLRTPYELLGFLWIIDDGTLAGHQIDLAQKTAARVTELLARRAGAQAGEEAEIEPIVLDLLAADGGVRDRAAADLRQRGFFPASEHYSVFAVRIVPGRGESCQSIRDAVRHAAGRALPGSHFLTFAAKPPLLLVGHRMPPDAKQVTTMAEELHADLKRRAPAVADGTTVGIASPVRALAEVGRAFEQASLAAQVAADRGEACGIWGDHPLEALLRAWLQPAVKADLMPATIQKLTALPAEILPVVEKYLDTGCNVSATSQALHLHRTTVYYRLNRLKELTGIDLADGRSRLLVHLWLKGRSFTRIVGGDDQPIR